MAHKRADRPAKANEVEVTEEMIDVGMDCFFDKPGVDPTTAEMREMLRRAFLRMLQVRRERRP